MRQDGRFRILSPLHPFSLGEASVLRQSPQPRPIAQADLVQVLERHAPRILLVQPPELRHGAVKQPRKPRPLQIALRIRKPEDGCHDGQFIGVLVQRLEHVGGLGAWADLLHLIDADDQGQAIAQEIPCQRQQAVVGGTALWQPQRLAKQRPIRRLARPEFGGCRKQRPQRAPSAPARGGGHLLHDFMNQGDALPLVLAQGDALRNGADGVARGQVQAAQGHDASSRAAPGGWGRIIETPRELAHEGCLADARRPLHDLREAGALRGLFPLAQAAGLFEQAPQLIPAPGEYGGRVPVTLPAEAGKLAQQALPRPACCLNGGVGCFIHFTMRLACMMPKSMGSIAGDVKWRISSQPPCHPSP